jgi:hypothetical protein
VQTLADVQASHFKGHSKKICIMKIKINFMIKIKRNLFIIFNLKNKFWKFIFKKKLIKY